MADEIVNTLGFNVTEALDALRRLDTALQTSGSAFGTFAGAIDNFNGRAAAALATMRGLASAATRLSSAMQSAPAGGAVPGAAPATAQAASSLWLPPGFQSQAQQAAKAMAAVGAAGQQAGQQTAAGMKKAADATKGANTQAGRMIVSWQMILRVVLTQAIVRAMSMIRDALHEAVSSAEDFQTHLAEIQTIAPRIGADVSKGILGTSESLASLQSETADFSKSFNIPLPQVTEGLYQTISNQFTSVADRSNVMTAAMKLSKVGVMDFQQAILLLTGTLNAYGMSSSQAEIVAEKFMETIRLGRIRGAELAQVLGQVIPIAKELGISVDQVNSAMVTLTIGGLNAAKSATALRGAMVAFLKPSEDMKKVLRSMGFADPEQFIAATGGIQEAIKAIDDVTKGSSAEMVKSFRRVRGQIAAFRLASEEGSKAYQEAMKAMAAATPENLDKILKQFLSTDAQKLQKEINALKTNLTQDFGQAMVSILSSITQMLGGADKMAAAITAIAAAAVPAAVALAALAAVLVLVHVSMGPIGVALLALTAGIVAGVGAYTYATVTNIANIRAEAEARQRATLDALAGEDKKIAKWKEAEEATNKKRQSVFEMDAAAIRKDYFNAIDGLKIKNQEALASSKNLMDSMVGAQERVVAAYRNAANAAVKAVQDSQNRQLAAETELSDTRFKYAQKRWSSDRQSANYQQRALDLSKEAQRALASAKSPDDIQRALAVFQRADAAAKEGENLAKNAKSIGQQAAAERVVLKVMRDKITAEKQLQQVQAVQAQALAKKAAAEQANLADMKTLASAILKDLQAFDSKGPKDPMKLKEQGDRLKENVARFQKLFMGGQKISVADLLGMDQLQRRVATAIESAVDQVKINKFLVDPGGFEDLRRQITEGVGPVEIFIKESVRMDPKLASEIKGMSGIEATDYIGRQRSNAQQVVTNFQEAEKNQARAQLAVTRFSQDAAAAFDKFAEVTQENDIGVSGASQLLLAPSSTWSKGVTAATKTLTDQAKKFTAKGANVTDADFTALDAAYTKYAEVVKPSAETATAYEKFVTAAKGVLDSSKSAAGAATIIDETRVKAVEAAQRLKDIDNASRASKAAAEQVKKATEGAYKGAQMTGTALGEVAQVSMGGLIGQIDTAVSAMQRLRDAAREAVLASAAATSGSGAGNISDTGFDQQTMLVAAGGLIPHFDRGGFAPKGTDTVPVMLSPGEFVMNARSTRRFYSQLLSMNAGHAPVYRAQGGDVSNVTVGDIHINAATHPRETAREVIASIKREVRRGTSKW